MEIDKKGSLYPHSTVVETYNYGISIYQFVSDIGEVGYYVATDCMSPQDLFNCTCPCPHTDIYNCMPDPDHALILLERSEGTVAEFLQECNLQETDIVVQMFNGPVMCLVHDLPDNIKNGTDNTFAIEETANPNNVSLEELSLMWKKEHMS